MGCCSITGRLACDRPRGKSGLLIVFSARSRPEIKSAKKTFTLSKGKQSKVAAAFSSTAERSILNVFHRLQSKWNVCQGRIYRLDEDFGRGGLKPYFFSTSGVYLGNQFAGKVHKATTKIARPPVPAEEAAARQRSSYLRCSQSRIEGGWKNSRAQARAEHTVCKESLSHRKMQTLVMSSQI